MQTARSFIAGGAAGSVACGVAYPLDFIKTKMAGDLQHSGPQHGGVVHYFRTILRQEGISRLYKGFGATLTHVTPSLAINYTAYELSKSYIAAKLRTNTGEDRGLLWSQAAERALLGSTAGTVAAVTAFTATFPLDVVRRRLQVSPKGTTYMWVSARA